MTRRDMIILAVLVNAGLLAILFMLAINTDDDKAPDNSAMAHPVVVINENEIPPEVPAAASQQIASSEKGTDEVDNALKDFADAPPSSQPVIVEEDGLQFAAQESPQDGEAFDSEMLLPEPAAEEEETKEAVKYVEITVKKGDVLEKIARANGTTVSAIKEANQLKNERLSIGQVLRVPVSSNKKTETVAEKTSKTKEKPAVKKTSTKEDSEYYTVKKGDNPWKIAKKFRLKVEDLLKLNDLNEERARNLKVGDKIRVR